MIYALLADTIMLVHFGFILFVFLGAFLVLRWPRLAWVHVPCFLYGGAIGIFGWICPLTYWENDLRALAGAEVDGTGFVERFVMPLIYPELLFPNGFPEHGFLYISLVVFGLNIVIYGWLIRRKRMSRQV